ncbi:MAG: hypothetical protein AMJ70_07200 [Dehalococcoidia bacterium SG8_51_3]|nr:MAG: hypothetical protein AMJ70_07200 [Dehalococcoidia bacterium SG8_51_3]
MSSLSALRKKNYLCLKAIITHLSAVSPVARQGKHGSMATLPMATKKITATTGLNAKCFLQYALNAAKISAYPLNHTGINQFTVAIVIARDVPYSMLLITGGQAGILRQLLP